MKPEVATQLEILKQGIKVDAPLVADFFENTTSLAKHAEKIHSYVATPEHRQRQAGLKKACKRILLRNFSEEEVTRANIDWETDWKINIVDHHGVLSHPILVATNIIGNMHQLPTENPRGQIVLSDSGVPLNNFFRKRGVKFHGKQLNIHPSKNRHVLAYAAKTLTEIPLAELGVEQGCSLEEINFLKQKEQQILKTLKDPRVHTYADQVKRINYEWWKELFSPELREKIPDVFYVPNEELGSEMLQEYLQDSTHPVYRILFDVLTREIVVREFMNLTGCWDEDHKRGSVFFWALNEMGEEVALGIEGNTLVSLDGRYSFEIKPEVIIQALREKKIFPGMFMVYGISIFYCGVLPLVGFGSMNYQTKMKQAWVRTWQKLNPTEASLVDKITTNSFIGGPKVTFKRTIRGFEDQFALDILFDGGLSANYLEHLRQTPFNAVLMPALIDIYTSYVRPERKQPITITSGDLMGESFEWLKLSQV